MRNLLIATTGFLVGTGLFVALLVALPRTTNVTVEQAAPQAAAMPHMTQGGAGMMASASTAPASSKLTIQHVPRGCHVWSNGKTTSPLMRLMLKPGGTLSILDQDIDAHQLMQLSGPMKLHLGGPMMTSRGMTIAFPRKGVYGLKTKTVEMPGAAMDDKTVGPDNTLRLMVTVA
jgi:hypothetical protein